MSLQIGAQISSIKAYIQTESDVLTSFQKISKMGYRIVQNQWINPDIDPVFIADVMQKNGLECVSTQDFFQVVEPDFERVIQTNKLWNSRLICVSGIPEAYLSGGREGVLTFAGVLTRMTERAREEGMALSFHPRWQEYKTIDEKTATDWLLDNTPFDCQLGLDLYHLIKAGEDPVSWIQRYAGRMDFVHFKESVVNAQGEEILVPIGQSGYDWGPVIEAAQQAGVKWGFAEQERWQKNAFVCMKESFEYLLQKGLCQ